MALRRRLPSGSPTLIAGPVSPPRRRAPRESTRSPALVLSGPWQGMQPAWRTGRILFSKRSTSCWASRRRLAARVSIAQYTVYRISYTRQWRVVDEISPGEIKGRVAHGAVSHRGCIADGVGWNDDVRARLPGRLPVDVGAPGSGSHVGGHPRSHAQGREGRPGVPDPCAAERKRPASADRRPPRRGFHREADRAALGTERARRPEGPRGRLPRRREPPLALLERGRRPEGFPVHLGLDGGAGEVGRRGPAAHLPDGPLERGVLLPRSGDRIRRPRRRDRARRRHAAQA